MKVSKTFKKGPKMVPDRIRPCLSCFGPHFRGLFWAFLSFFKRFLKAVFRWFLQVLLRPFSANDLCKKAQEPCNFAFWTHFSVFWPLFAVLVPFDILVNHFFTVYDNLMIKHFPQWILTFLTFDFWRVFLDFFHRTFWIFW